MDGPHWFSSLNKLAAVYWRPQKVNNAVILASRGRHYVAVKFKEFSIVACYISPNSSRFEFLEFLDETGDAVRTIGSRIIVAGDFNSKSTLWGSRRTDDRGAALEDWSSELDLRLINCGTAPICVRAQGISIVDLTWVSPDLLGEVQNWRVVADMENLSDHPYIAMEIGRRAIGPPKTRRIGLGWNWRKAVLDKFSASLIWRCSVDVGISEDTFAKEFEQWVRRTMIEACDRQHQGKTP